MAMSNKEMFSEFKPNVVSQFVKWYMVMVTCHHSLLACSQNWNRDPKLINLTVAIQFEFLMIRSNLHFKPEFTSVRIEPITLTITGLNVCYLYNCAIQTYMLLGRSLNEVCSITILLCWSLIISRIIRPQLFKGQPNTNLAHTVRKASVLITRGPGFSLHWRQFLFCRIYFVSVCLT